MVSFSFFSIASSSQSMKTVSNQNGHGAKANPFWAHGFFKIIHLTSPRSMKQQFRGQNKAEVILRKVAQLRPPRLPKLP